MRVGKSLWFALALGASFWPGSARAGLMVRFVTTATFSAGGLPGTTTFLDAADGIRIVFGSSLNNRVSAPPASFVSFGTFDTSATTGRVSKPVVTGFTLDIFQTAPTAGKLTF